MVPADGEQLYCYCACCYTDRPPAQHMPLCFKCRAPRHIWPTPSKVQFCQYRACSTVCAQRRWSVGAITSAGTTVAGKPELNGLSDLKMGPTDRTSRCTIDNASQLDCPGYFGHIELAKPMYHIGFFTTVLKTLRCVSFEGSKLMCAKVGRLPQPAAILIF